MSQFSTQESHVSPASAKAADASALALPQPLAAVRARLSDHLALTKPGITIMVVLTALIGFIMAAAASDAAWSSVTLLATLAGTGFSCMGASAFNQAYERDTDALMRRTATRPLPAGRLHLLEALASGTLFSGLGIAVLWLGANWLAAAISAFTIVSYSLIYTPLKRRSSFSTIVGAVPGAMPPVIGAAAASGSVDVEALLLFTIMFVWQLPHFWAIGLLYRDQYAAAGLPILPVIDETGRRTRRQILVTSLALLVLGVLPTVLEVSGYLSLIVATTCGLAFLVMAIRLVRAPERKKARALFLASLAYLPIVLTMMLLDQL